MAKAPAPKVAHKLPLRALTLIVWVVGWAAVIGAAADYVPRIDYWQGALLAASISCVATLAWARKALSIKGLRAGRYAAGAPMVKALLGYLLPGMVVALVVAHHVEPLAGAAHLTGGIKIAVLCYSYFVLVLMLADLCMIVPQIFKRTLAQLQAEEKIRAISDSSRGGADYDEA